MAREHERVDTQSGDCAEYTVVVPQFSERGIRHPKPGDSRLRPCFGHKGQLGRIRVGQRPKQDGTDNAENGGVGADTESKR